VRCVARPRAVEVALFAVALGLGTHVRGNALILVMAAPIAFWWVWRGRDQARPLLPKLLAYGIGLALVLVPLSNEGMGFNLYLANTLDNPTPYYRPARFAPAQPAYQAGGFVLKASLDVGRNLSVTEARDYYDSRLRADWARNLRAAAMKVLAKLAASVNVYEHAHNHNLAFVSRFVPPLAWPWIGFGLLFPLAMLGIVDRRGAPECQWLIVMAIAYWLTLVVFFTEIRLRAPLALLLMPLGAIGLRGVFRRRGRALAVVALVFGCGFVVTHLPVPGAGDLTTAYNLHALMLFDSGDYQSAERYYRTSHGLAGLDSDSALLGLAAIAIKRSDLVRAHDLLLKMRDDHYKAGEKYEQLGDILVVQHRFDEAGRAFERALEINPGILRIYPVLEMLYAGLRSPDQVTETRKRYQYAASFFE
jgi:tetratricopeptide (TPR) repeat protein